ncbi:hypothetical protein B5X24_HaOG208226 [Helicoverpa armigera]|uniref:Uncharacterized protein n=1 Tax=Helicoverpa armigera TaxID=29058 RepID=A0A2W1BKH8_HELAM|nr:hypothetical protein B5X24_HaOG208226 [Helicoverpa armigera]
MSTITTLFCVFALQALFLSNASAQILMNRPRAPQIQNLQPTYTQPRSPLITSLLTTNAPFEEKINTIMSVIQTMPKKCPGRVNKKMYMAEALKKSALESLMFAANACKCTQKAENRIPLATPQVTVGNDVLGKRAGIVRYY